MLRLTGSSAALGAILCASSLFCAEARANGAFPAVSQFVFDPANPEQMVLRGTFGMLFSTDGGKVFNWICEPALHYQNILPAITVLAGGELVYGVPDGAAHTSIGTCDVDLVEGFDGEIVDVTRSRDFPDRVLVLEADFITHESQIWESSDRGASYTAVSQRFSDFLATTLDVAPSDPDVIYLSGKPTGADIKGRLYRSVDHGATFVEHDVPGSIGLAWPYIAAVDPTRSERVYVRLDDLPGRLKVTDDGGETWVEPLAIPSALEAFALSPDGATVLVSSVSAGTFRASADTLEFEQITCSGVSCFTWNDAGLFACGDQFINGFILGRSNDQGVSYERLLDLNCIHSDYGCSGDTRIGSICPMHWTMISPALLGSGYCGQDSSPPPIFTPPCASGGSGGSGGQGGESGDTPRVRAHGSGCGCRSSDSPSPRAGLAAMLALAASLGVRRRRRRASQ